MKTLKEYIEEAKQKKVAIGHFNISTIEGLWAIVEAAKELNDKSLMAKGLWKVEMSLVGVGFPIGGF